MKKVSLLCLCGAVLLGFGVTDNVSAQTTMGTIKVPVGATGKSAYQIWKEAGHTGSEADFLASLVGVTGAAGQDGAPGCATTITKSKTGKVTTLTAKDCNNNTVWTETVSDGTDGAAGQDGAPGCADKVDISDKNAQGCYTITKTPYSLVNDTCTAGTPDSKQVCDGANGTTPISCEATITMSDKDTSTGCYTITTQKRKANAANTSCVADGSATSKQVCDGATGAPGTNGTNGCATTLSKATSTDATTGKKTVTVTAKDCNNNTIWTETVQDGIDGTDGAAGQDGAPGCADEVDISDKNAQGCYTITKTPYSLVDGTCTAGTPDSKQVCDGATGAAGAQGETGPQGPAGADGKDRCDDVAASDLATTEQNTKRVYVARSGTTRGYTRVIVTYCDGNTTEIRELDSCAETPYDSVLTSCPTGQRHMDCKTPTNTSYSFCETGVGLNSEISKKLSTSELGTALKDNSVKTDLADAVAGSGALSGYSTTAQMNTALANKADTSALSSYLQTANLGTALKDTDLKTDLASAVAGSGALTGYLTSADASSTYATQTALNTADGKITALETTVGDSNSGLVKQVATNTSTIGNASGGLVKDVADAKTSAANAVSTANTASTDASQAKQDAASALSGLDDKLNKTDAQSTYLSQTDASNTYLNKTDASSTYLTQNNAQSTYATKSALTTVETTANNAANDASSAVTTANTASGNATRALNKATTNETNISSLNTTVSGHTTSITSLTSRASTLESAVNGTCSGSSTSRGSSESGIGSSESGGDSSECTQSLESRIRALEVAVAALQNN